MLKKCVFYDFLNRRTGVAFDEYLETHRKYEHFYDVRDYVLPFDYGDAEGEYRAIRGQCGLFDGSLSHKYHVFGEDAGAFLDQLLTRPVSASPSMRGIYALFCNEHGALMDDAIVYKKQDDDYLLMPAFHHNRYFEQLLLRTGLKDVRIVDCSDTLAGLSIQGPLSATVLKQWGLQEIDSLKLFDMREYPLGAGRMLVSRMGFTGDLGYECWFDRESASIVETALSAAQGALGVELRGYGLTAMQACRLECGLVMPGVDCATVYAPMPELERSPYELGLGWLVKFDDRDFVGRDALMQMQAAPQFALLSCETRGRRDLPPGTKIYSDGGEGPIGVVTSSAWSWGLERTIGHVSVERRHAERVEACAHVGEERVSLRLRRGPLLTLERRRQVPAPIGLSAADEAA